MIYIHHRRPITLRYTSLLGPASISSRIRRLRSWCRFSLTLPALLFPLPIAVKPRLLYPTSTSPSPYIVIAAAVLLLLLMECCECCLCITLLPLLTAAVLLLYTPCCCC